MLEDYSEVVNPNPRAARNLGCSQFSYASDIVRLFCFLLTSTVMFFKVGVMPYEIARKRSFDGWDNLEASFRYARDIRSQSDGARFTLLQELKSAPEMHLNAATPKPGQD